MARWFASVCEGGLKAAERPYAWTAPQWLARNKKEQLELMRGYSHRLALRCYSVIDEEKSRSQFAIAINRPENESEPPRGWADAQNDTPGEKRASLPSGGQHVAKENGEAGLWRNLEARFRALQPDHGDELRAEWDDNSRQWQLPGAPSDSVLRRFKQAAAYAAKMRGNPRADSALDSWLGVLKREPGAFHLEGKLEGKNTEKGRVHRGEFGTIHRVCEVSADYCGKLAHLASAGPAEKAPQSAKSISKAPWASQLDIIKRRAIVKKNTTLEARGVCELFDANGIPLTKRMKEAGSWAKAYRGPAYRHSIDSLICRDRKS